VEPTRFHLVARVSSDRPAAVRSALAEFVGPRGSITPTAEGFLVEADVEGADARDLNRSLLTALRRAEKRTRLRSEWTGGGMTQRFFDYVPKGTRPALPRPLP